jgi:hypothetical protein
MNRALLVISVPESFRQHPLWTAVSNPAIATGMTPLRYQQLLRLERAEHLIGHGATVEAAARAVGFRDPRMLRRLRGRPVTR